MGDELAGGMEVALRVRRRLEQLPVPIAIAVRCLDLARGVEHEPQLRRRVEREAVGRAPRHVDVVVLGERNGAEDRLELPAALVDEEQLVAIAVAVERLGLGLGLADRRLEVGVPHQRAPPRDRIARRLQLTGLQMPVDVRVRDPFLVLEWLELAGLGDPARRLEVVKDRLVAAEALEPEHLLDQQPSVVAELHVALPWNVSEAVVSHLLPPAALLVARSSLLELRATSYE